VDPTLHVTVSVGVAPIAAGQSSDATLAHADLALYAAKGAGRNRARLFSDAHYQSAAHRVSLLQRVGAALETGTMRLYAQPIVDLRTGSAARHELLIRLRDGQQPPLSPADFLPAAERTDLVLELDRWVLQRAVRALANPRAQAASLRLEVNVSARSLENPDLGRWILEQLKEAEVAPERLGLEITETTAIKSLDAARLLATRLTEAGCGFALDDFGAGYGSFSYLKYLPFTTVKIAGEFVRQADDDAVDRALVSAVVGVAHQLGMRTVAEQVDRPRLVTHLRTLGVDDGQGFHLGRPQPLDALLDQL
jgi:EAL domain-containing protein (putative c-di-GMP-specific phosphodiesterase class I)